MQEKGNVCTDGRHHYGNEVSGQKGASTNWKIAIGYWNNFKKARIVLLQSMEMRVLFSSVPIADHIC